MSLLIVNSANIDVVKHHESKPISDLQFTDSLFYDDFDGNNFDYFVINVNDPKTIIRSPRQGDITLPSEITVTHSTVNLSFIRAPPILVS